MGKYVERISYEQLYNYLQEVNMDFPIPLSEKSNLMELANKLFKYGTIKSVMEGEEVCGLVAGYTKQVINNMAYISIVSVKRKYRGQGIGSKLVKQFVCECKRKELSGVHLYTHNTNCKAIDMYKRIGFREEVNSDDTRKSDVHFSYYFEES